MTQQTISRLCWWTVVTFALISVWDLLGQDLALARVFGTASGFPLRDHWLWSSVLHQGARRVAWTLQFGLLLAVWWPVGVLRVLTKRQRVAMLIASMLSLVVVSMLKTSSQTSCPWDLAQFGGNALYISHWNWGAADGGVGRCFPAGHASAAFCFLPGYFWLRDKAPRAANIWLALTLVAGSTIGLAQQVRGAHYLSHNLWTAWLCWVVAGACYLLFEHTRLRTLFAKSRGARPY